MKREKTKNYQVCPGNLIPKSTQKITEGRKQFHGLVGTNSFQSANDIDGVDSKVIDGLMGL